jgi:hypothetical protein
MKRLIRRCCLILWFNKIRSPFLATTGLSFPFAGADRQPVDYQAIFIGSAIKI